MSPRRAAASASPTIRKVAGLARPDRGACPATFPSWPEPLQVAANSSQVRDRFYTLTAAPIWRTFRIGLGEHHVERVGKSLCDERRDADAAARGRGSTGCCSCASRAMPGTLVGLLGLSFIHFARWVIIRRDQWPDLGQPPRPAANDYMLFCSNFNGTWDQYIDAFADGIPGGLDLFWYSSTKYPHSIPITPFKNYIRANQIDTDYYYNATPGAAQRDIKSRRSARAAARWCSLLAAGSCARCSARADFAEAYREGPDLAAERSRRRRRCAGRLATTPPRADRNSASRFVDAAWPKRGS